MAVTECNEADVSQLCNSLERLKGQILLEESARFSIASDTSDVRHIHVRAGCEESHESPVSQSRNPSSASQAPAAKTAERSRDAEARERLGGNRSFTIKVEPSSRVAEQAAKAGDC